MRKLIGVFLAGWLSSTASAAEPPLPPEVARTVNAFAGKWTFDGVLSFEGKEVKGKLAIDCRKIALGKAVSCSMKGKFPGFPDEDDGILVGYDIGGKAVHFMAITSGGEVHDHSCQWKGEETLDCGTLAYTAVDGSPATEELAFTWADARTSSFRATITVGAAKVRFEGKGRRK
jgi:hypothetical protein